MAHKIKVIGIGGAGCNTVNNMHRNQLRNVELVVCNTDAEAISASPVKDKLLLEITSGEGTIAPDPGSPLSLTDDCRQNIKAMLSDGTEIVFIVAGMGGIAGTVAAPIAAQVAKKLGVLAVAITILPFSFESKQRTDAAAKGVRDLEKFVDSLLVLSNDKLRKNFGHLTTSEAFRSADEFIANTVRAVADTLSVASEVNVDIEDVITVMGNAGTAVVGSATAAGENRTQLAIQETLNFPLLVKDNIQGARKVLLSIVSGAQADLEMEELTGITEVIQEKAGDEAEIIFGHAIDPALESGIQLTLIATGFPEN